MADVVFTMNFIVLSFTVCSEKTTTTARGDDTISRILFFDDGTLERIDFYELELLEQAVSCCICTLTSDEIAGGDRHDQNPSDMNPNNNDSSNNATVTTGKVDNVDDRKSMQHREYFVVGTGYVVNEEQEASRGRILVFELTADRKVSLVTETEVGGGVYSLTPVCGRLAAGVGSKVSLVDQCLC